MDKKYLIWGGVAAGILAVGGLIALLSGKPRNTSTGTRAMAATVDSTVANNLATSQEYSRREAEMKASYGFGDAFGAQMRTQAYGDARAADSAARAYAGGSR